MNEIVFPDYQKTIVNLMASIQKYYNIPTDNKSLDILDNIISKKYKNVVLMVFDGMGVDILEKNLSDKDFLRKNILTSITSVYPTTTTAALTSYYTGLTPNEHGWIGWSVFFKEFCRCIDEFSNCDSFSGEFIQTPHAASTLMPYTTVFEKINIATNGNTKCYTIYPFEINSLENSYLNSPKVCALKKDSSDEICSAIENLCSDDGNKFIFSYFYEPDSTMHKVGCYAQETKEKIKLFNNQLENMCNELEDTLIIISADHGHINIDETIFLNEIKEIDECLIMPPSVEPRALSFFVKSEMKDIFKQRFEKLFSNDFILLSKEEVFEKNLLGYGVSHIKTKDFIGDFFACAVGNKKLAYKTLNPKLFKTSLGSHAGLTKQEMIIPLILIEKNYINCNFRVT